MSAKSSGVKSQVSSCVKNGVRGQVTACVKNCASCQVTACVINGARGQVSAHVMNGFARCVKLRKCGMSDVRVCVCVRRVCVVDSTKD